MLTPIYERSFERDLKKAKKRGLDTGKLKAVIADLISGKPPAEKHRNHKLKGDFIGYWECHIAPDWLLIYKKENGKIYFARTGTHADLFE